MPLLEVQHVWLPTTRASPHRLPQVPVALVSASPESRVKEALELAGMATQFEVVVTAEDVYRGRPDPEGYLFAAQVRTVCSCGKGYGQAHVGRVWRLLEAQWMAR